jgi:hypothetical protein
MLISHYVYAIPAAVLETGNWKREGARMLCIESSIKPLEISKEKCCN